MELSEPQAAVLQALASAGQQGLGALANATGLDQSPVAAACAELQQQGLLELDEQAFQEITLTEAGRAHVATPLPERTIVGVLQQQGGSCRLTEIPQHCDLNQGQVGQSLRWLLHRKWARKEGDQLVLDQAPDATPTADEALIQALADGQPARSDTLAAAGHDLAAALEVLSKRKGFVSVKDRTDRTARLTDAGRARVAGGLSARKRVTRLTPEMLADGSWRQVELAPYDVTLAAGDVYPGKEHPFQRIFDQVRRVFLEMGFTEIASPWVESSFWDFDALFQPQDHPARDMQDTFYIGRPARSGLPDAALVERVRATHENGGGTGSTGWRYRWEEELAHRPVLRTHTTAATIRALARHTGGTSGKYFVTGPVFRRETVDYKHLPMFHQVDGIIVDEKASLANLLGTLAAFYRKMGFPKVRFRPSFFPYTEPSVEVDLWLTHRNEWVEMGGSGIFRPEVTRPLGVNERVLAWGLGLERLAMMIHKLKSIGELYFATMPWLRETPLCR